MCTKNSITKFQILEPGFYYATKKFKVVTLFQIQILKDLMKIVNLLCADFGISLKQIEKIWEIFYILQKKLRLFWRDFKSNAMSREKIIAVSMQHFCAF